MTLALALEVEARSRPANYLKSLLVPGATVQTLIPLASLQKSGQYKDWVLLEQPKFGCVNVHLSRADSAHRPSRVKEVLRAPLFRHIPRYDSEGCEPASPAEDKRDTEVLLHPYALSLKPGTFTPLCDCVFFVGLDTSEDGSVEKDESVPFISVCDHPLCRSIAIDPSHVHHPISGNLRPCLIYSHPSPPRNSSLPHLCFPCGLQLCFSEKPPDSHHSAMLQEDGKVWYLFTFYGAVSAAELGGKSPATVYVPTVLGIVTAVRDQWTMARVAESIVYSFLLDRDNLRLRAAPTHHDTIVYLTEELPAPGYSQSLRFQLQGVTFDCKGTSRYSVPRAVCKKPQHLPSDDTLIAGVSALLMEKKVLVVSQQLWKSGEIVLYLRELLYPLDWPHTTVPELPITMIDVLVSSLPVFAGVAESYLPVIRRSFPDALKEVVLIRLDLDVVVDPAPTPDLPKPLLSKLKNDLKSISTESVDDVRAVFTRTLSALLSGYRDFVAYTNGAAYINKTPFLQSVATAFRPFLERFLDTFSFALFLQRHTEVDKYHFHRLSQKGEWEGREKAATVYIAPPANEPATTSASSGTHRDALPSPRRLPTFDTFHDFSYSDSEDEGEIVLTAGAYQPIGLPAVKPPSTRCFIMPEASESPPKDAESVLPGRAISFSSAAGVATARVISSAQALTYKLLVPDPRYLSSITGQILRLLLTSNLEPTALLHLCSAVRNSVVRCQFLATLRETQSGKAFEVRYRSFMYLAQLCSAVLGQCVLEGDFATAGKTLVAADSFYYVTPRGGRDYLICELAGCGLWTQTHFWHCYVESTGPGNPQSAFTEITKAAGLMAKLDVEEETAKTMAARLGTIYRLEPDLHEMLPILTAKFYLARAHEQDDDCSLVSDS